MSLGKKLKTYVQKQISSARSSQMLTQVHSLSKKCACTPKRTVRSRIAASTSSSKANNASPNIRVKSRSREI